MRDYSLIETQYDLNYRDVVYSLLPVTNTFIYREVRRVPGYEANVRRRLNDWYQAKEIVDPAQKAVVQQVRRGERNPELALAEVAKNAIIGNDFDTAEQYFQLALERNQTNWQIHRDFAEFYRHQRKETLKSIQHYREAVQHAPKQGPDKAKILREYGVVLRNSGIPNAYKLAAEQLEAALNETPSDPICRHALGDCYVKSGSYLRAVEVLEPLLDSGAPKTREKTAPLLLECYEKLGEMLKSAELRARMNEA